MAEYGLFLASTIPTALGFETRSKAYPGLTVEARWHGELL